MNIAMRKIISGIILILMIQCVIFAQDNDLKNSTPEDRAKIITEWMQEKLSLEPSQVDAVYSINLDYAAKNIDLMNSNESRRSKFRKLKSGAKEKDKELKNIFTKDQFDIYQDRKKELRRAVKDRIEEKRKEQSHLSN